MTYTITVNFYVEADSPAEAYKQVFNSLAETTLDWESHDEILDKDGNKHSTAEAFLTCCEDEAFVAKHKL